VPLALARPKLPVAPPVGTATGVAAALTFILGLTPLIVVLPGALPPLLQVMIPSAWNGPKSGEPFHSTLPVPSKCFFSGSPVHFI